MESQGKLEDAMELYGKALEIKKNTLGDYHSSVADTYYNMAMYCGPKESWMMPWSCGGQAPFFS
jgi:hypothetical protein